MELEVEHGVLQSQVTSGASSEYNEDFDKLLFNRQQALARGVTEDEINDDPKFDLSKFYVERMIRGDTSREILQDKDAYPNKNHRD